MSRIAIVLFNLGGPDRPESVEPFLFNLFSDPAILDVPQPFRWFLAKLISRRRAPVARKIYAEMGGGSPLLPNTEAQAAALQTALSDLGEVQVSIAMRYWHPMTDVAVAEVRAFGPDHVVLLPLYPQFSKTTSGSSLGLWQDRAGDLGAKTTTLCCYPRQAGFIAASAEIIRPMLEKAAAAGSPRLLFSAHGLPKKVVAAGDPYQWQVEQSAAAVVEALAVSDLDWQVCYQSRVGPLEWIGPSTDEEIKRAGADQVPVVLFPIAFVSEHSETLVELDIEYAHLAEESGVPAYYRAPTVSTQPAFIEGLADLVRQALNGDKELISGEGGRICPTTCGRCPLSQETR